MLSFQDAGPGGAPREFPAYQRGPPQAYMDRIAEKRKLEEVRINFDQFIFLLGYLKE